MYSFYKVILDLKSLHNANLLVHLLKPLRVYIHVKVELTKKPKTGMTHKGVI